MRHSMKTVKLETPGVNFSFQSHCGLIISRDYIKKTIFFYNFIVLNKQWFVLVVMLTVPRTIVITTTTTTHAYFKCQWKSIGYVICCTACFNIVLLWSDQSQYFSFHWITRRKSMKTSSNKITDHVRSTDFFFFFFVHGSTKN